MLALIIPYYKLTFFEATLESLANQTDKRFKVYIGDDASPESPVGLLEKYEGKFDFVYHRFETNLGAASLVKQWERCIELSNNEEWIMILGDDDMLEKNVVEAWYLHYEVFIEQSNIVRFATKVILETTQTISSVYLHPVWEKPADAFVRIFKQQTRSSLSEYVFSKKKYLKYGFTDYPLAWCSDYKALLDFSEGKLIYTVNESIVFFRISNINISGRQDNVFLKNEINIRFFKDIVVNKMNLFDKPQRLELLMAYEIAIKRNREPEYYEWFFIIKLYLLNFELVSFVKCVRRFYISILKI